jgi:hypothetical protein
MVARNRSLTPEKVAQLRVGPVVSVWQAQLIYGIGKNKLYSLMSNGSLSFKKVGHSTLILTKSLERLVGAE